MAYDNNVSMANIVNVAEALSKGGMKSCENIADRIWVGSSNAARVRKITTPADESSHTTAFARMQIRREVRRTLHSYFTNPENPYDIYRATAYKDTERFWVSEVIEEGLSEEITSLISSILGDSNANI